jgi:hypothetical protein
MNGPKRVEIEQLLENFSPRLREVLRRLAYRERRTELQELVWLIESRAFGHLLYNEWRESSPLIPLDDLPPPLVELATLQRKTNANPEASGKPPQWSTDDSSSDPRNKI